MQSLKDIARYACRHVHWGQSRTFKDLPKRKNKFVEAWYDQREDMEMTAKITPSMLAFGFMWGVLIPYIAYEAIVMELRSTPRAKGQTLMLYPDFVEKEPGIMSERMNKDG
jgi:hypothetical protein